MRDWCFVAARLSALCALTAIGLSARAQSCAPVQLSTAPGSSNDSFGAASAATADTVVLGAPGRTVSGRTFQGQAFVFRFTGTAWTLEGTLTASDGAQGDSFGSSVSISGNTIIVGAYAKKNASNAFQGAAYIFTRSGTVWSQQAKLLASDGAADDLFGYSVSISGDSAIIGAYGKTSGLLQFQGAAYIFTRSGTTWTEQAKLLAPDGATNDFFGLSVSISGQTAAIGAPGKTIAQSVAQGATYVFTRSSNTWSQQARLTALDGASGDYLGSSVAVDADTVAAGALYKTVGTNLFQGAAYTFTRTGISWSQQAKLVASDGGPFDYFGGSVALSGDSVVLGADNQTVNNNASQGAAYTFERAGLVWSQLAKLTSTTGAPGDFFGQSVALVGTTAVAGAPNQQVASINQGACYIFGSRIPINLIQQPATVSLCPQALANLSVTALGSGPFTYLWQWRSSPTFPSWTTVNSGLNAGGTRTFSVLNATTPSITVSAFKQTDTNTTFGDFRVIVSNTCGNAISLPAAIRVCWGDINCDGHVDDNDFVLFAIGYDVLQCSSPEMPALCPADLNADNLVDDFDFAIFAVAYDTLLCP